MIARHTTAMDNEAPSEPERQDIAMADRPTSFAERESIARLELTKRELIYVAKENF